MLSNGGIKNHLPHRYPFLLVDKIIEREATKRAVGIKNVSSNEPFFQGHFPHYSVMPGVLIVEALAQVGGFALSIDGATEARLGMLAGIENCRFKRQVKPGDQLRLEFEVTRSKGMITKGKGTATVDEELICEVEIVIAFSN